MIEAPGQARYMGLCCRDAAAGADPEIASVRRLGTIDPMRALPAARANLCGVERKGHSLDKVCNGLSAGGPPALEIDVETEDLPARHRAKLCGDSQRLLQEFGSWVHHPQLRGTQA